MTWLLHRSHLSLFFDMLWKEWRILALCNAILFPQYIINCILWCIMMCRWLQYNSPPHLFPARGKERAIILTQNTMNTYVVATSGCKNEGIRQPTKILSFYLCNALEYMQENEHPWKYICYNVWFPKWSVFVSCNNYYFVSGEILIMLCVRVEWVTLTKKRVGLLMLVELTDWRNLIGYNKSSWSNDGAIINSPK